MTNKIKRVDQADEATKATRVRRYTEPTGVRNQDLRRLLYWLEDQDEPQGIGDVEDQFKWTKGRARTALVDLMNYGLVIVADTERTSFGVKIHLYSVVEDYDEAIVDHCMPITPAMALKAGFKVYATTSDTAFCRPRTDASTTPRYYLDVLLMGGMGPAPSLSFHERSACQ